MAEALPADAVQTMAFDAPDAFVRRLVGISRQGMNPQLPDKPNQDALVMHRDESSGNLLLSVMDGHGEHGHFVSALLRELLPALLFSDHPRHRKDLQTNPGAAIRHALSFAEKVVINVAKDYERVMQGSLRAVRAGGGDAPGEAAAPAAAAGEEASDSSAAAASLLPGGSRALRNQPTDIGPLDPSCLTPIRMVATFLEGREPAGPAEDSDGVSKVSAIGSAPITCMLDPVQRRWALPDADCGLVTEARFPILRRMAEAAVRHRFSLDVELSGSTAVVCLVQRENLTIANVGDSRLVLLTTDEDGQLLARRLTTDFKPTLPKETRRILLRGGVLRAIRYGDGTDGPVRVWLREDEVPGLAMSRSVCDCTGKRAGVTSDAEVTALRLTERDAFLVVASDGLFEFVEDDEVGSCVHYCFEQATAEGTTRDPLKFVLDELVQESCNRWLEQEASIDDTTIILAQLGAAGAE